MGNERFWLTHWGVLMGATSMAILLSLFLPGASREHIASLLPIFLAGLGTVLAITQYFHFPRRLEGRRIWLPLVLVFGSWFVAELIWYILELLEVTLYPSLADAFYLLGDIFLFFFFQRQVSFLRLTLSERERSWLQIGIGFLISITLTLVGFTLAHGIQQDTIVTLSVSLLYNALYLLILIRAFALLLVVRKGLLGISWVWFTIGIIGQMLINQLFFFADLFSSDFMMGVFNVGYVLSYEITLTGLFLHRFMPSVPQVVAEALTAVPAGDPEVLFILTGEDGRVLFADPRLPMRLKREMGEIVGEPLQEVLGISSGMAHLALRSAVERGYSEILGVVLPPRMLYALQAFQEDEGREIYWLLTPWQKDTERMFIEERSSLSLRLGKVVREAYSADLPAFLYREYLRNLFLLFSMLLAKTAGPQASKRFSELFDRFLEPQTSPLTLTRNTCFEAIQRMADWVLTLVPENVFWEAVQNFHRLLGEEILAPLREQGVLLERRSISRTSEN